MPDTAGLLCSNGSCTAIEPELALALIALESLIKELSKEKPFGPNNEIAKILRNAQKDIKDGPGDSNEIVKILRNAWSDITKGPGPNNEIRKFFESLGIRI